MRFRKKPVEIEAWQWKGSWGHTETVPIDVASKCRSDGGSLFIDTLEGTMEAKPNDWLIRGVKGELYPCKPDIFEATYDPV